MWFLVLVLVLALFPSFAAGQERSVVDDAGRTVSLPEPAQRMIGTSPANTQLLFALEVPDKVVGVTSLTSYLSYVPEIQRLAEGKQGVGDATGLNLEQIIALQPDLVVLDGDQEQLIPRLERLATGAGFAVYVNSPQDLNGIIENVRELGTLAGAKDAAQRVARRMRAEQRELRGLREGLPRQLSMAYLVFGPDPLWTAGADTFLHNVFQGVGLANVFDDVSGYTKVSREQLIQRDPDVLLLSSDVPIDEKEVPELFGASLSAVQHDRVHRLSQELGSMLEQRQTEVTRGMLELFQRLYEREGAGSAAGNGSSASQR